MEKQPRDQLVEYGASLYQRGYCVGSAGNLSVRLDDGLVLATPTNACLGRLEAGRLARVRLDDGRQVDGDPMSKEIPFHLALYRARPDCRAVVHLHSTYLTALSCRADLDADDAIRAFTPYYVMKAGRLPVIPYFRPGSPDIAGALTGRLAVGRACLMANHGAVTLGPSLAEAANTFEELEETARLFFILDGAPVRHLTAAEVAELWPASPLA